MDELVVFSEGSDDDDVDVPPLAVFECYNVIISQYHNILITHRIHPFLYCLNTIRYSLLRLFLSMATTHRALHKKQMF